VLKDLANRLTSAIASALDHARMALRDAFRPAVPFVDLVTDVFRPRKLLLAENVLLRQQLQATLARRCLQGMIRDFWSVSKNRLKDEIDEIRDKLDSTTGDAIDAVHTLGNIGAHMEKDINTIVDVDPGEAELLLQLIETLIKDWYITRHTRAERMAKLIEAAAAKK
jgi:hypothetical protein